MLATFLLLAAAPPATTGAQAVVTGVSREGIQDYKADGTRGLYILPVIARSWYYARFSQPCLRLPETLGVTFQFSPIDRLDKDSAILVAGQRCRFDSLTVSGPPPKRRVRR